MGGRFLGGSPVLLLTTTAVWLFGGPAHDAQDPAAPDQLDTAARSRSRAAGRSRSTISASGVSRWLFTQPVLRCSTEPSVEPSRNRLVIQAGAPRWGQGMVSDIGVPFPGRTGPRSQVELRRHRSPAG